MADAAELAEQAPVQDRDLLQRLSLYFDAFEQRLRQGQGWFIFNADGKRGKRISTFIERRLDEVDVDVDACMMPWRDFALSAYVTEVGLPELEPRATSADCDDRLRREFEFARQVTEHVWLRCQSSELLVVTGLQPRQSHEAMFLDRTVEQRYASRKATILLTPEMPSELEADLRSIDPTETAWNRLFSRMYETSLVAL
ncbi:MAG: hypothetical protein KC438_04590 [Thermomicrobiales bacterium]|nr:hypothetical protein [Thermomicrobiales bacterium]MCO5220907.1 hypothetical protein [Thermomicrobiales bacterium]